jgi:glycerol-3-phosphate acyltransferase PlsY
MNVGIFVIWSFLLGSIATSAFLAAVRLQDIKRLLEREWRP